MQALVIRLERFKLDPSRDARLHAQIEPFQNRYIQAMSDWLVGGYDSSELDPVRWALESYRVSLFAQELKTRQPVSAKRLQSLFSDYGL